MIQKLTKEQGIILTGFTGVMCCKWADFHEDVERRLGRPIFTHEFASKLMEDKIKELYRENFIEMVMGE